MVRGYFSIQMRNVFLRVAACLWRQALEEIADKSPFLSGSRHPVSLYFY